jgi:SAM-dependent methyltransferase
MDSTAIMLGSRALLRRVLAPRTAVGRYLSAWRAGELTPSPGHVRFGSLRRLDPLSRRWGYDRGGTPVDRVYIERFLARHAADVRGHVLEVQDAAYTRQFGGDRVERSDVLHAVPGNPAATIVADLVAAPQIPADTFDCIILTQVLPFIEDVAGAVATVYRILRPGGVVLATVPGISQVARRDMDRWGDYWRFTTLSARRLFERTFPADAVQVESHGNVLVSLAFLYGLASNELRAAELDHDDPDYQLVITVRATKPRSLAEDLRDDGTA